MKPGKFKALAYSAMPAAPKAKVRFSAALAMAISLQPLLSLILPALDCGVIGDNRCKLSQAVFAEDTTAPNLPVLKSVEPEEANESLTVEDVKIEGNRLVPSEEILNVVKTKPGDKFNRDRIVEDLKAVNGMGYFDDRNLQVVPEMGTGGVLLKIRVQENSPVTQFSIQGNNVLSTEEISKLFTDQLGRPQNLNQLSGAIDRVEKAYHEKGFVLARVVDVKDDPDGSISLTINEGTISDIQISGNKKTKDFIIRNNLKLKPGMAYNERQLTNDLRKLYGNGYFQDIRRSLVPSTTAPDKYTLKVDVDEKRTGSVGLGGGVDTVNGPFGSVSFSDANFRGRGQMLSMNAQVGAGMFNKIGNDINNPGGNFQGNRGGFQLESTFIEPNIRGSNTSMAVSGFARNFASVLVDSAQQQTLGASVTFSKPLKEHYTASLGFIADTTTLSDVGSFLTGDSSYGTLDQRLLQLGKAATPLQAQMMAMQIRQKQLQGGAYLTVNPQIQYDTRDNAFDPTRGTYARVTASPSIGLNGGFVKLGASKSIYKPVGKKGNATFAFNVQGGTGFGGVPQFSQYRLGGLNGIRGYRAFSDLGTGTAMLMASAEMRFKLRMPKSSNAAVNRATSAIQRNVKFVAFADAGQVAGNTAINSDYGRSSMGASTGIGFRLNVPMVGLVRVDYGFPIISTLLGGAKPRFTVGFGDRF